MKLKKLLSLTVAAVMAVSAMSVSVFAENNLRRVDNDSVSPLRAGLLFEENVNDSDGVYVSTDFSTTTANTVNVYFNNEGTEDVEVKLFRASTNLQVGGTLTVAPGVGTHMAISSGITANTSYYVQLETKLGSRIVGYVRVRQL